jgi:hypothetical protein
MDRLALYHQMLKGAKGTAVEVGTCWGGFAEFLATKTGLEHIFCVDPYKVYPKDVYNDALNTITQEQCDMKYATVLERLNKTKKITMMRCESERASLAFPDDSLMFVYIDGNHHFSEVLKDLCFWWTKVAPTGILAGDDVEADVPHKDGNLFIEHQPGSYGLYGVRTALVLFSKLVPTFKYSIIGSQFFAQKAPKSG